MRDSEWEARAVRLILLDLIGKVRREHVGHDYVLQPSCGCDIGRAADYAETRLRMVRDD